MNRFILPMLAAVLACTSLSAQDYSICSQVIGASGNSVLLPGQRWTYTVGEGVIGLIADPDLNMAMTIGFNQPEWCSSVSTKAPDLSEWDIRIYPNPTADRVWLDFQPVKNSGLQLAISDIMGRQIYSGQIFAQSGGIPLDCSLWQPGIYFLQLTDTDTRAQGTFRLIRL